MCSGNSGLSDRHVLISSRIINESIALPGRLQALVRNHRLAFGLIHQLLRGEALRAQFPSPVQDSVGVLLDRFCLLHCRCCLAALSLPGAILHPPKLRFIEPLRGYEDYAITTDRATVADVSWRYPLIIDKGVAATLWVLPSSFLRELDFELFASGAIDRHHDQHAAVGAAVELRINLLRLPLLVIYQIARRVRDDDALTQLVGIGPDL